MKMEVTVSDMAVDTVRAEIIRKYKFPEANIRRESVRAALRSGRPVPIHSAAGVKVFDVYVKMEEQTETV